MERPQKMSNCSKSLFFAAEFEPAVNKTLRTKWNDAEIRWDGDLPTDFAEKAVAQIGQHGDDDDKKQEGTHNLSI